MKPVEGKGHELVHSLLEPAALLLPHPVQRMTQRIPLLVEDVARRTCRSAIVDSRTGDEEPRDAHCGKLYSTNSRA